MKLKNKTILIVQARLSSTRFPSKVIQIVNKKPMIFFLLERLKKCKKIDKIVFAIPNINNKLFKVLKKKKLNIFLGSEHNVLERYYLASRKFKAKTIIRITGDCPFADYNLIDRFIEIFNKKKVDYLSNNLNLSFPHGLDIEIFTYKALEKSYFNAESDYEKEHVTPYIRKNEYFKKMNIYLKKNFHKIRLTIDFKKDLEVMKNVLKLTNERTDFGLKEIIDLFNKKKKIFKNNKHLEKKYLKNFSEEKKNWVSKNYSTSLFKI